MISICNIWSVEYADLLKDSQSKQMPVKPLIAPEHVAGFEPKCYTNFRPHHNKKFMLSDILVGMGQGWELTAGPAPYANNPLLGYQDFRPAIEVFYILIVSNWGLLEFFMDLELFFIGS